MRETKNTPARARAGAAARTHACRACGDAITSGDLSRKYCCDLCEIGAGLRSKSSRSQRLYAESATALAALLGTARPKQRPVVRAATLAETPDVPAATATARGDYLTGGARAVVQAHSSAASAVAATV